MDDADQYRKNVGFTGGISLLFSSITGPGMVIMPYVFQQGGWLVSTLVLVISAAMACFVGLVMVEATAKYPENSAFQKNVEMTTLVYHFYGRKWHNVVQLALYLSFQTINISSIVISAQTIDNMLINVGVETCGFQLTPTIDWVCVNVSNLENSPFSGTMLFTYGFLLLLCIVIPLLMMNLNDNIVVQFFSTTIVVVIIFYWFYVFAITGLNYNLPAIGPNVGQTVGNILLNYAFVTTVPSWICVKHPKVSVHSSIIWSISSSTLIYFMLGLIGGLCLPMSSSQNILSLYPNPSISILFPIFSLVSSIPVCIIIVRSNLVQARVAGRGWAIFLSAVLPFLASIFMLTGSSLSAFMNYGSLVFVGLANFISPLLIYLFLKQRVSDALINQILSQDSTDSLDEDSDDIQIIPSIMNIDANGLQIAKSIAMLRSISQNSKKTGSILATNQLDPVKILAPVRAAPGLGEEVPPKKSLPPLVRPDEMTIDVKKFHLPAPEEFKDELSPKAHHKLPPLNAPEEVSLPVSPETSKKLPPLNRDKSEKWETFSISSKTMSFGGHSSSKIKLNLRPTESIAPGYFVDAFHQERLQIFHYLPILDAVALNQIPDGYKVFKSVPDSWNPKFISMASLVLLTIGIIVSLAESIVANNSSS